MAQPRMDDPFAVDFETAVPKFIKVTNYTTFLAEYTLFQSNIVVHFFMDPRLKLDIPRTEYWAVRFPSCLDRVAREYFAAEYPRLTAKFTEEMDSWWFRAKSYDHIVDIPKFMEGFFDLLDSALEGKS